MIEQIAKLFSSTLPLHSLRCEDPRGSIDIKASLVLHGSPSSALRAAWRVAGGGMLYAWGMMIVIVESMSLAILSIKSNLKIFVIFLGFVLFQEAACTANDFTLYGGIVDSNNRFDNTSPENWIRDLKQVRDIIINQIMAQKGLKSSDIIVILAYHGILTQAKSNSMPRLYADDLVNDLTSMGIKVLVATEGYSLGQIKRVLTEMKMGGLVAEIGEEATPEKKELILSEKDKRQIDVLGPFADTNKKAFVPMLTLGLEASRSAKHIVLVDDSKRNIINFQRDRTDYPDTFAPDAHFYYIYAIEEQTREQRQYPEFFAKSKIKKKTEEY